MRSYCCIPNCNSSSVDKEPGLSFHEFPTKNHFRNRWLKAIKTRVASDFQLDEKIKTKICSKHFKETDFSPMCSKRRRLKGCAVPSLFPDPESVTNVLELEIVVKKDVDESHNSSKDDELLNHSFDTNVNRLFSENEDISNISFETHEEPDNCTSELYHSENLSDSLNLEMSSQPNCKTSELDVTSKNNNICHTEIQKKYLLSNDFLNTVDGLKKISAQESNLCEFTIFGLYVASQLQQMPLEDAYKLKEKIQNILTQSCPQSLKEPSFFSYTPQISSDRKNENTCSGLQAKSLIIKNNEKDKNQSIQHLSSYPVILQSFVLPSTAINTNVPIEFMR
ncbi:uncharacterized protein LOC129981513 [Argiope bruennichi]|uniref:uncharacterized protein LOC129981513 n=1 Tax=Argiope bruennichi TaxID=94029 RepID=UPI002493D447|nr:uncharacterized protein LOC129981513 [Argiope bruennichi]